MLNCEQILPKNIIDTNKFTRNKSSSMSSALKNSLNTKSENKSFLNVKNYGLNSFFVKKSPNKNNLANNQFQQFKSNINMIKKPCYLKKTCLMASRVLNLKSETKTNDISHYEHYNSNFVINKKQNFSNSHINSDNNNSTQNELNVNFKKIKNNIPKNSGQSKRNIKINIQKSTSSNYGSEKNPTIYNKKDAKLDNSVTIISNRLISELNDLETNLEKMNSTKDNSLKSLITNNKFLDPTNMEDIHILFVKFYQQSRKIEKCIKNTDTKLTQIIDNNENVILYEEIELS